MSKKLKNLKWESVPLEGFPASLSDNFQGFVGLEECTSYSLDKDAKQTKKAKKKKPTKKRKNTGTDNKEPVQNKKVKLNNGFIVETCETVTPSTTHEDTKLPTNNVKQTKRQKKRMKDSDKLLNQRENSTNTNAIKLPENKTKNKNTKPKLGENTHQGEVLTAEDMLSWAEFKLPDPIIKAMMELGFKNPTKIQQLTLPAAIHGRRDILGAAETGSGKTLAFGLPILTGIMKLKEKGEAGFDVYEVTYKKTSGKKKPQENNKNVARKGRKVVNNKKSNDDNEKHKSMKAKESSEDSYSSGDDNDELEHDEKPMSDDENSNFDEKTGSNSESEENDTEDDYSSDGDETNDNSNKQNNSDEEYIEEIDVPLRKKTVSSDEGNESDDIDENYIHLSDILDSDDLVDSSSNEETQKDDVSEVNESCEENNDENESDNEIENEEVDGTNGGIGCVKVIDNIELPGPEVRRTGKPLYALIVTPTRELAIQISRHLIAVAKYTGIRIATIVGGMASVKQERVLKSGPEVVVATPGRLWELLQQGQPHLQQLNSVRFLAIDETDRMVERNHFEELQPILERLNADETRRGGRQNFVFSATLTMVHDLPSHLKGKKVTKRGKILNRKIEKMTPQQKIKKLVNMIGMTDPKVVDITQKNSGTAETLTESRIACSLDQKDAYLYYILKRHPGRTIVFCNSIGCVKRLTQIMSILKCNPLPLHAGMEQRQRLRNLERLRDNPRSVLVATDVAARGLDIPDVDHVVHYQVPRTAENYVHRSGRTARANKEGLAILMMEPAEAYLYAKLCRTLNKTSEVPTFPVAPETLSHIRELVALAREIDSLELKKRRVAQAEGWKEKVAREMDIIIDEDDIPSKQADPGLDKALKAKRRDLNQMLSRPLIPRGFSYKYPTLNDPNALKCVEENALQVMKKALQSGELKKERRKGKNESLLKLEKSLRNKK